MTNAKGDAGLNPGLENIIGIKDTIWTLEEIRIKLLISLLVSYTH